MESDFGFTRVEQHLVDLANEKKIPLYGGLELTPYCNMSCEMCYVHQTRMGLPILDGNWWVRTAKAAVDEGALFLLLTGGEPLLHPEFPYIYRELQRMGVILTINTNGTLIDETMADFFAKSPPRRINISLYGASEETYEKLCHHADGFEQTKKAIELLLERKMAVKVNIIVNAYNFHELDAMLALCKVYGVDVEINSYLFEPLRKGVPEKQRYRLSPDQMVVCNQKWDSYRYTLEEMIAKSIMAHRCLEKRREEERSMKQACMTDLLHQENEMINGNIRGNGLHCRAGSSSFWITWNGRMTPCVQMPRPAFEIAQQGFRVTWQEVITSVEQIHISQECGNCHLKDFCLDCAAAAYHETGRFEQKPQICCEVANRYAQALAKNVKKTGKDAI